MTPNMSFCRSWFVSRRSSLAIQRSGGADPSSGGDVHVLVVEHHPDLGALGRRRAFARHLLDEVAHRRRHFIDASSRMPSKRSGCSSADGAHRGAPGLVSRDHRGRDWRRWSVDRRRAQPPTRVGTLRGGRVNAADCQRRGQPDADPGPSAPRSSNDGHHTNDGHDTK